MVASSAILAAANPQPLIAFPGWKQPVLLHLKATIGANGQPTVITTANSAGVEGSTPGLGITETANDSGIYDVTFPPARRIALGTVNINILPDVLATVANHREARIEKSTTLTNATTGKLRFNTSEQDAGAAVAAPPSGSEIHLSFWVDLG